MAQQYPFLDENDDLDLSGLPNPVPVTDMDLDLSGLPNPTPISEPSKYEPQPDPVTLFRNRSVMEKPGWLERFRTPLTDIGRRTASSINEMIPESEHPLAKFGESTIGFLGSAIDEMTAPINALPLALTGGGSTLAKYGLGALGKLVTGAGRITSAPAALSGFDRMKEAESIPEFGMGALEAVGGLFGMRGPKIKSPQQQELDNIINSVPDLSKSTEFKGPYKTTEEIAWQLEPTGISQEYIALERRMRELGNKEAAGTLTADELTEAQKLNKLWRNHPEFGKTIPEGAKVLPTTELPKVDLPDYSPSSELAARKVLSDRGIQVSATMSNKQIIDNARAIQGATNPVEKLAKETPEIIKPGAENVVKVKKISGAKDEWIHPEYPDYVLDSNGNILRTLSGNPVRTARKIEPNIIAEILNTPRAVNASADLSFPLRQGITLMHKPGWWKAWGDMAKSFGSERAFKGTMDSILEKPNYKPNIQYKKYNPTSKKMEPTSFADWAGLTITDNATLRELEHMRSLAERVPGYKQIVHSSNRGYTAFANKLRSDTFDSLVEDFTKAGMDPRKNQELAKSLASFVNSASGRGSMESLEKHMEALNIAFFSPRLQISRAQMLGRSARALFDPRVYDMSAPNIRREYLKSMLALGTAWSTAAGLAHMAGAEVSLDPTNPDFMKVKIGNTRLDMGGGFQQFIVLANKMAQQRATSSTTGKTKEFSEAKTPFDPTELSTLERFGYSKLAPIPRAAIDLAGRTQREPFDLVEQAARLGSPILVQDLMEIYMNEGDPTEYATTIPSAFGVGSQTYGEGVDYRRRMLGPNFGKNLAFPQKTR